MEYKNQGKYILEELRKSLSTAITGLVVPYEEGDAVFHLQFYSEGLRRSCFLNERSNDPEYGNDDGLLTYAVEDKSQLGFLNLQIEFSRAYQNLPLLVEILRTFFGEENMAEIKRSLRKFKTSYPVREYS